MLKMLLCGFWNGDRNKVRGREKIVFFRIVYDPDHLMLPRKRVRYDLVYFALLHTVHFRDAEDKAGSFQ